MLDFKTRECILKQAKYKGVTDYFLSWLREWLNDQTLDAPAHYYLWAAASLSDFPYTQAQLDKCAMEAPGAAIEHAADLISSDVLQWCKDNRYHTP